jgi:hypothetical protein
VTLRSLSLVSLLAALALGGWLLMTQMRETGPTSATGKQAIEDASAAASTASFQAAAPALQAWFAEQGTYAGATLPPAFGVRLARADATSYCLEAGTGETARHLVGPGGSPAPGPCTP